MIVIVGAIVGFLAGRMLWLAMRKTWHRQPLLRKNYQGTSLPTAAGIVIALSVVLVEAGRAIFSAAGLADDNVMTPMRAAALVVVVGFAMVGLLDDLIGGTTVRGFGGHLKALAKGELTSGAMKLFAGAGIAVIGASMVLDGGLGMLLVGGAVIALSANLANLFDLRPGRTTKVSVISFALLALLTGMGESWAPVAVAIGAGAALVLDDLHERLMLGDTGANALGAVIGLGMVSELGSTGLIVALVVLVGLNLLSEVVSFSKLIETVGPLRMFDQFGRRRPATIDVRQDADDKRDQPVSGMDFYENRPAAPSTRATVDDADADDEWPFSQTAPSRTAQPSSVQPAQAPRSSGDRRFSSSSLSEDPGVDRPFDDLGTDPRRSFRDGNDEME